MPRAFPLALSLVLVVFAIALTAITPVHAAAQTLTVDTTMDGHQGAGAACSSPAAGGACTLRAAIDLADRSSGDTIAVPAGTYGLTPSLGFLDVTSSMSITGAGSSTTIVDGGRATVVLGVGAGSVSVSGLSIRNGELDNQNFAGADISSDGTLTLTNVVVTGGSAPMSAGGGIASDGPLTLENVVVSGNHAGDGGGLALFGGVTTTISRSTISGNSADGAVIGIPGLRQAQFPGHGGGIALAGIDGAVPRLTITQSTISGNKATGPQEAESATAPQGGGISDLSAVLNMSNDTVAGNTAIKEGGGNVPAVGGGIAQTDVGAPTPVSAARTSAPPQRLSVLVPLVMTAERTATSVAASSGASTALDFVTVAGNSADRFRGISSLAGRFTVADTIVAANVGGDCGNPGEVTSTGYNLESAADCGFSQTGDQTGVDPKLDALKVNPPGATATMALLPGSPAIDAADPKSTQSLDQRGVGRPQGVRRDIGAFEVEQAAPATSVPSPPITGATTVASLRSAPATAGVLMLVLLAGLGACALWRRRRRA
jgi:hypothetical protein